MIADPVVDAPTKTSRTPLFVAIGVVVVAVVGFLAFGVFGIQTAFIDDEVNEAGPVFESGASVTTAPAVGGETPDAPAATTEAGGGEAAVTTAGTGAFEDRDHPGEGTATILTDGNQSFVRFEEDFSTDNGPDLYAVVYVDGELVELEPLKGNQGAQNYELPADIDPSSIEAVAVWCKRFDVIFTEAPIA